MKSIILNQKLKHLNRRWRDILTHLASLFLPVALTRQVFVMVDGENYVDNISQASESDDGNGENDDNSDDKDVDGNSENDDDEDFSGQRRCPEIEG